MAYIAVVPYLSVMRGSSVMAYSALVPYLSVMRGSSVIAYRAVVPYLSVMRGSSVMAYSADAAAKHRSAAIDPSPDVKDTALSDETSS